MRQVMLLVIIFLGLQFSLGFGADVRPMPARLEGVKNYTRVIAPGKKGGYPKGMPVASTSGPYHFDWLNPSNYKVSGYPSVIEGNTVYSYTQGFDLWRYDITNKTNPKLFQHYLIPYDGFWSTMDGLESYGGQLYMTGNEIGITTEENGDVYWEKIFDVNLPTSGTWAEAKELVFEAWGEKLAKSGNHLFCYNSEHMELYEFFPSASGAGYFPSKKATLNLPLGSEVNRVCSDGNLLYICLDVKGVQVYDITVPTNPVLRVTIPPPTNAGIPPTYNAVYDIAAKDGLLYLVCANNSSVPEDNFFIMDLHDPTQPRQLGACNVPDGTAWSLTLGGGMAYASTVSNTHVYAINVTTPASPTVCGRFDCDAVDLLQYADGNIFAISSGNLRILRFHPQGTINITNLNRSAYRVDYFRPGNTPYVDKTTEFVAPGHERLKEQAYLVTHNGDLDSTASGFVSFDIDQPATVIVAYDERARHLPSWLANWPKTGQVLATTDATAPGRVLYSRTFPAGRVHLGGNRDEDMPKGKNVMYSVFVVPNRTGVEGWGAFE